MVHNALLTLKKTGQQAASSLHSTDGDCLTTCCLPFQTVLSTGLLLLHWIRKTHKLNKREYYVCFKKKKKGDYIYRIEYIHLFLTFLKQFNFVWHSNVPWKKPWIFGTHIQWHCRKRTDTDTYKRPGTFYSLSFHFPAFTGLLCTIVFFLKATAPRVSPFSFPWHDGIISYAQYM